MAAPDEPSAADTLEGSAGSLSVGHAVAQEPVAAADCVEQAQEILLARAGVWARKRAVELGQDPGVAAQLAAEQYFAAGPSLAFEMGAPAVAFAAPQACAAFSSSLGVDRDALPKLQEPLPRSFAQQELTALGVTTRRSALRQAELAAEHQAGQAATSTGSPRGDSSSPRHSRGPRASTAPSVSGLSGTDSSLAIVLMTSSGEDSALFDQALSSAGFKAVVLGTPAVAHMLRTGDVHLSNAVPVMTAAAAQQAAGCSSSSAPACAKQAQCGCARCVAEDDSAPHGPDCSCLACLPADAVPVDAATKQLVESYMARDASISFVDCESGMHVGI